MVITIKKNGHKYLRFLNESSFGMITALVIYWDLVFLLKGMYPFLQFVMNSSLATKWSDYAINFASLCFFMVGHHFVRIIWLLDQYLNCKRLFRQNDCHLCSLVYSFVFKIPNSNDQILCTSDIWMILVIKCLI